jgi:pimeloyl-ACP methyl ester carboxylesterase
MISSPQLLRQRRRALLAAALTVGLAGTAGVAPPASAAPGRVDLATGGVHAPVPRLTWTPCTGEGLAGLDCTTGQVPLDYDRPNGTRIGVAAARRPADDQANKVGTLFLNPGGPGGSGVDFVPAAPFIFRPEILARFDIVGLDPRGTNRSAPVRCFRTAQEQQDFYASLPIFPYTVRQTVQYLAAYKQYTRQCARLAAPIIDHASTANFVRDLDLFRQAVGDPGFSYIGYSYGTYVGETYAALFPSRVRAIVIDGVLDPERWATGQFGDGRTVPFSTRLLSAQGAYESLGAFFRTCVAAGPDRCAFATPGATARDLAARYAALARRLLRRPIELPQPDGSTFPVTYDLFVAITLGDLYSAFSYPDLAGFLRALEAAAAAPAGTAAAAAARAAASASVRKHAARFQDEEPLFDSGFDAVSCADTINPRSQLAWPVAALLQDRRFPYFGSIWTYASMACATWPGFDSDRYLGPFTKRTAHPLLVVGQRYDPATRYQAAVEVSRTIPGARLLSVNGYGHTSLQSSVCADTYTADYLVDLALPPAGTVCQPDRQPFDPLPTTAGQAAAARTAVTTAALPAAARSALARALR